MFSTYWMSFGRCSRSQTRGRRRRAPAAPEARSKTGQGRRWGVRRWEEEEAAEEEGGGEEGEEEEEREGEQGDAEEEEEEEEE